MNPRKRIPPAGQIRRSQLVTTAGPGALVDLIDHAVVLKGLDSWQYKPADEGFIMEPRLAQQALAMLRSAGHWKHNHVRLRLPPRCEDSDSGPWRGIHAREFPQWSQCRRCKGLVRRDTLNDKGKHTCFEDGKSLGDVVPVRFLSGCPRGHIQDVYWRYFLHRGVFPENIDPPFFCAIDHEQGLRQNDKGQTYTTDMALWTTGTSGELSDMVLVCRRCGARRSLQDLRHPHALGPCRGWRPWLRNDEPGCEEKQKLLIRTGSNVWFPQRLSVLTLPERGNPLPRLVEDNWDSLKKMDSVEKLRTLLEWMEPLEKAFCDHAPEAILGAIQARRAGLEPEPVPVREAEWDVLYFSEWGHLDDLPPRGEPWFARRVDLDLPDFLDRVVLVHALREVRALVGFTRIEGVTVGPEGELELAGQQTAPLGEHVDWIPAVEVLGEGVFLAFDEAKLAEWEARDAVIQREAQFREGLRRENALKPDDRSMDRFTSARMLMLHSIAHMLITQISLECGYSASAIRERIYCYRDPEDPSRSRAGILLYTGTPGSEGTLGGLIEVGKDIVRHLARAVERHRICSNDPVCAQHQPDGPEEGRRREGAACHACLLIAEPSCERMNRDLDRALVVETLEQADAAFLAGWSGLNGGP